MILDNTYKQTNIAILNTKHSKTLLLFMFYESSAI